MIESPHFCGWHVVRQVAFGELELRPPLSQTSPLIVSMTPLPQVSLDLQSAEQPSPAVVLPSSQASPLVLSRMLSPPRWGWQLVRHDAFGRFELAPPASHSSPSTVSVTLSPHLGSWQLVRHGALG